METEEEIRAVVLNALSFDLLVCYILYTWFPPFAKLRFPCITLCYLFGELSRVLKETVFSSKQLHSI